MTPDLVCTSNKNRWNHSGIGNYWSDWTTPDQDTDGIVDFPYNISGTAGAKDYFPLADPWIPTFNPPFITTTDNTTAVATELYMVNYTAVDFDTPQANLVWSCSTNASN